MSNNGGHISQEMADEFAIGSLEQEMERLVALHAAECVRCREVVFEAERVAASLGMGVPLAPAPPRLKKKVLVGTGLRRPGVLHYAAKLTPMAAGLAAIIVAAASFTGMVSLRGQVSDLKQENLVLRDDIRDVASQEVQIYAATQRLAEMDAKFNKLEISSAADRQLIAAMMSPESKFADVTPQVDAGNPIGRLIWEEDQERLWFVADKLPQLPTGQTYQIWVDINGDWQSLGTFNSDTAGTATYVRNVPGGLGRYASAVVTIETIGGSPGREGQAVFLVTNLPRDNQ